MRKLSTIFTLRPLLLLSLILPGFGSVSRAGNFSSDFNSGLPPGSTAYGNSAVLTAGGVTNSGVLKLTAAAASETGSFVIDDLDAGQPIQSFVASFKALVGGGTGADGFSFNFANDIPNGPFGEVSGGTGLTVTFDTFANPGETAPTIRVFYGGANQLDQAFPLRTGTNFVDVIVKLDPDGTLDVAYNGTVVISNFVVAAAVNTSGRFAFGARTGGTVDNHFIDNLTIATKTVGVPYVESATPLSNARADVALNIILKDFITQADTNSIQLTLDGSTVTPIITADGTGANVYYQPLSLLVAGSHLVNITFADNTVPTPVTNSFAYGFTVAPYGTLSPSLAAPLPLANVDTNSPGFTIRVSQISDDLGATVSRAEKQLANTLIDPTTDSPYVNLANPNSADGSFIYYETNAINFADGTGQGNFPDDAPIPGIPGALGTGQNVALDAVTYLHLSPGLYTLGVNSADGFRLTTAVNADITAGQQAMFDGARVASDTTVSFQVNQEGYYPFRVLYFAGGGTAVPDSLEFFSVDVNGTKTLINDPNSINSIKAFRVAISHPYIQSASPSPNETGVPNNTSISISLIDGSLTVVNSSIQLSLNGTVVTPSKTTSGTVPNVTTITYTPAVNFPPKSTNTIKLVYTDSGSRTTTNQFTFVTALNLNEIWSIAPNSSPYVRSGTTERGIAYNPATDHVLVVSRNGGNFIAVFNATTGAFIKTMDTSILAGGTFPINMVDVTDDGVIYAANLAGLSATKPIPEAQQFKIYRWANEDAAPVRIYNANPSAGTGINVRFGDTLRVRGAGSGTQILVNGNYNDNNAATFSTNAALFTTIDGTNFIPKLISVSGINPGDLRLGCAFGCGNTFYGAQTTAGSTLLRYVGFDPVSGNATALATYILNVPTAGNVGTASVGPIGVDQASQRLIGNATSSTANDTHSMNLYDLATLAASPAQNFAVDQKTFPTANVSFGTGNIDFTPNGDRVFTLDTANGIKAFNLAPITTMPSICTPPVAATNRVGSLAFFGVEGSGTPKNYQWRFNGVNISGETGANLNIPNVQRTNAGLYSVVIFNSLGAVTSAPVRLSVTATILAQPLSQVVNQDAPVTFTTSVDGESPIRLQWRFNGVDLPDKTNATLSISSAQVADAGNYSLVASNLFGSETSQVVTLNVVTPGAVDGTGTGLTGEYYSAQLQTFINPVTLTRLDPTVDFAFGEDAPDGSVTTDTFTVRWNGQVQPRYSQNYTFYTTADDGVRLWVNGRLLIDKWINQAATEWSGTIALNANQKYDIIMEYYENTSAASAHLSWGSASEVKAIIPATQLYPGPSPAMPSALSSRLSGSNFVLDWSGTFTLQSSTNVAGPYVDVLSATRPYTNSVTSEAQQFFLLKN